MKYTKKQITVEALLWTGNNNREMWEFLGGSKDEYMTASNENFYINHSKGDGGLVIKTSEGDMFATIGDMIIKEPFDKERKYYPCKPDIFAQTYSRGTPTENPIQHLMKMQNDIGYVKGPINVVALLGLFGEAGEVLAETVLVEEGEDIIKACDIQKYAIDHAREVDWVKKQIRDKKVPSKLSAVFAESGEKFDIELADEFYYLLALAQNRGLTLDQLAAMSIVKIQEKQLQKNISHATNTN